VYDKNGEFKGRKEAITKGVKGEIYEIQSNSKK
jgi:hypothetical protein